MAEAGISKTRKAALASTAATTTREPALTSRLVYKAVLNALCHVTHIQAQNFHILSHSLSQANHSRRCLNVDDAGVLLFLNFSFVSTSFSTVTFFKLSFVSLPNFRFLLLY